MATMRTTRRRPLNRREVSDLIDRAADALYAVGRYHEASALNAVRSLVKYGDPDTALHFETYVQAGLLPAQREDLQIMTFLRTRQVAVIREREHFQNGRDIEAEV